MFMMKDFKKIMLLCTLIVAIAASNVSASPYKLFSSTNNSLWPGMLVSIYGETSSIRLLDNYESMRDGTVKAIYLTCNDTITYNAGYGVTEYPGSSNEVYVYFKGSSLYAESPYFPDLNGILSTIEFRSKLNNMLQRFRPDLYSALSQEVARQKEQEKNLAQQRNNDAIAAIQADPTGRHALPDNLWLEYQPDRIQIEEPSLAAYYENNVIHYGSYYNWRDNLPEGSMKYVHMDLKRNNVTNYGQYIIVINENNDCTCFDYDASNDTFIIYDNKTQKPDYTLHFTLKKHVSQYDPNDSTTSMVAEATNISGNPIYDRNDDAIPWKTIEYGGNICADFWSNEHNNWLGIYIPNSRIDGYRLFLQYQSLLN